MWGPGQGLKNNSQLIMENRGNIKKGIVISYAVIIFSIAAGLVYTPWMVSQIGRHDYGLYILAVTFLSYFVVDYGMWQSINILISKYLSEGNQEKIEQTIGVATKIYLFIDIILSIALFTIYFLIDSIFSNLSAEELIKFKNIFLIAAVFSVLNFPFNFLRGIMFAYGFIVQNRYFELFSKVVLILTIVTVLIFGGGLYWLVLVYAFVPLLKNIFMVFFLYKQGVKMDIKFWSKESVKAIFGISAWLFVYVIAELFINNISPAIITIRSTLEQVAVFAIGLTIYGYVYQISNAIAGFFIPKITRMRQQEQHNEIEEYAIKMARFQLIISGFIIFGIIVSGSQFIYAWLGEIFANSYYVASVMVIPGLIINSQQIEQSKLCVENKIYLHSSMMLLTAISSVTISIILVPKYGAIGAAIAIASSNLVFMAIGMSLIYHKFLKFDARKFYAMLGRFLTVFILAAFCAMQFDKSVIETYFIVSNKWLKFLFVGVTYAFLYGFSVYYLLLNRSEKGLIKGIYSKAVKRIKR